jgi:hypothetical protein
MGEQRRSDAAPRQVSDAGHQPDVDTPSNLVWKHGAVTCLYQRHGSYNAEVRLVLDDAVIQREFFADAESAFQFAQGKKRAYTGS